VFPLLKEDLLMTDKVKNPFKKGGKKKTEKK